MSAQPFSIRQATNGTAYSSQPLSAPGAQYPRPGSRPSTSVGPHDLPPNTAPLGFSRQQRSEPFQTGFRSRQTVEEGGSYYSQQERERDIEAERARQQRIRDKAPGLRRKNTKAGEIDAVLEQVKDGWEFVIDPDFNHVDLALQLLDKSSVGKDIESFRKTKNVLSNVLRGSVDKHYQAFAASLPLHASLLTHLNAVQTEVSSARSALLEAKDSLGGVRADLVQVWSRGQVLEEMIKSLDQIEYLKTVPDLLETLMSEKRLLQGSILLVRSLKIINKADMQEIGAVADLKSYLEAQETALRDILTDELQSHLYLKSFWCESRWAPYVSGQQEIPKVEFDSNGEITEEQLAPDSPPVKQSQIFRYLSNLSLRPNDSPYDINDNGSAQGGITASLSNSIFGASNSATSLLSTIVNPEADSFVYMETLLESLAVLGKLGSALDIIAQRLPGEIFALVEATVDEVEERQEFVKSKSSKSLNERLESPEGVFLLTSTNSPAYGVQKTRPQNFLSKSSALRLSALESLATRVDHEILRGFFWTLYSKLVAVTQGFRVVTEVVNRIGSRRDSNSGTKPGTLFSLTEIWDQLQAEVRGLIRDYLVDEQQGSSASRNPISSINEILRDGKFNRERVKPAFRFADTDMKTTNKTLRPHEDGLNRALKDTMPGLAPGAGGDPSQTIISSAADERLLGVDQHHRLLARPDAFHVTVLFQPTLCFLHRVAEILPIEIQASRTSTTVLDDFVLKVYLPQLEEKVLDIFHHAVTGPEAFLPDPISRQLSSEPIVKASIYLLALINSLCAMLNTSPFHRENYSRLILAVVIQFYQRCSDRFHALTADSGRGITREPFVVLAAQWAQHPDLQANLAELSNANPIDMHKMQQIYQQETVLELGFMEGNTLTSRDLVSVRNLASLTSLQHSVSWFISELRALRSRSGESLDMLAPVTTDATTDATPTMPPLISPISDPLDLPLSREMDLRFQSLSKTYEQLSSLILDTIRLDLRCRAIYYLDSSMLQGTYNSHYEATEPDPYIVDLNAELVQCDEFMAINLPTKERRYVFAGLGYLMEHVLIANAKHLRHPTAFGIKKLLRNILALQQVIKTLTDGAHESEFERAREYYSLFFTTPQEMLDSLRIKPTFRFEDYQTMLNLQCGIEGEAADRNYSTYLLDLQCLGLEHG